MKTELIKQLNSLLQIDCSFELDHEDNKIDVYGTACWGANSERKYIEQEFLINEYKVDNDLISLSCWCDISGYDYWMVRQEESNYVSIDVHLKKDSYTDEEIIQIRDIINEADDYFCSELTDYYSLIEDDL